MLLLFFVFCGIYSWYYQPKNQGKVWKINQWETYGAKSKGKKEQWRTNFGIAFGAVLVVPSLLTGYIENVFGVFLGLLFTATLPAVIVDAVYAAIYIRKHPKEDSLQLNTVIGAAAGIGISWLMDFKVKEFGNKSGTDMAKDGLKGATNAIGSGLKTIGGWFS